MIQKFEKVNRISGELKLKGDKSISHRAVMFACMASGVSRIKNLSNSEDVKSTVKCFEKLGCGFQKENNELIVTGKGYKGFVNPASELFAGNSGTTARLMTGILAAQNFESVITGDSSLSSRPMNRIIEPLKQMGAVIKASGGGKLPLKIIPVDNLKPINYKLPVASAQVKSAVLLAGLHLEETSTVLESLQSRNHTENMLGLPVSVKDGVNLISSNRMYYPEPKDYIIPADISSAAFFIVLALLTGNSELKIKSVSLNETRDGVLRVLKQMGAEIVEENVKYIMNEKIGDLIIKSSVLHNVKIEKNLIPNLIDEIPVLSVAGIFAKGGFYINNAEELRFKESDRISGLCNNFKKLGLHVEEFRDGFSVEGEIKNKNPEFDSFGDHRIAMSLSVLSMLLKDGGEVNNFECTKISNPGFLLQIKDITK